MKKAKLKYIEYNIVGHCNLNCKGCSHFSNIQKEKEFVDVNEFGSDLERLASLFTKIRRIRILGGEPLLHPQFDEIIKIARKKLPDTMIDVVTNGLLLNRLDETSMKNLRDNNVTLIVSVYKPVEKIKNDIIKKLEDENVKYILWDKKIEFRRQLTNQKRKSAFLSYISCDIKKCVGMKNGKIGKCPMSLYMYRYNNRFSKDFHDDECMDLYNKDITAKDIIDFTKRPIQLCKYCSAQHEMFDWEIQNYDDSKAEDWILKNDNNENIFWKTKILFLLFLKRTTAFIKLVSKKIVLFLIKVMHQIRRQYRKFRSFFKKKVKEIISEKNYSKLKEIKNRIKKK